MKNFISGRELFKFRTQLQAQVKILHHSKKNSTPPGRFSSNNPPIYSQRGINFKNALTFQISPHNIQFEVNVCSLKREHLPGGRPTN